jgi:hypothetical protein
VASNAGFLSSTDPVVMRTLNSINTAIQKTGDVTATTDPLLMSYSWLSPAMQTEHQPAIRVDYNLGTKHRLTGTFNKLWQDRDPDQLNEFDHRFPDSPNYRHTVVRRPSRSIRSGRRERRARERAVSASRAASACSSGRSTHGPQTFEDTAGYAIDLDGDPA